MKNIIPVIYSRRFTNDYVVNFCSHVLSSDNPVKTKRMDDEHMPDGECFGLEPDLIHFNVVCKTQEDVSKCIKAYYENLKV